MRRLLGLPAILLLGWPLPAAHPPAPIEFNRDIRPILAENCFACHGPDSASRKGDLRLDLRDAAISAGAIHAGKPTDSELIRRVYSSDSEEVMPPPTAHKSLSATQKELLRRWIAEGAVYQPHWSFIAPRRPVTPAGIHPIDHFVRERLRTEGLAPAGQADRRTLARRVSLDLTGLPPDPAAIEAVVNDPAPDWYEKYVDTLMQSPHWGEHRGRYWLDAARYADTHGIHFDNYREMWSYRDWVIRAFNDNMPFDRFTIEQLAGDLVAQPTLESRIATGFNRCNITTNEGGAIDEEYLVLYARDRTETASIVFMGLTTGCAVCHDHKLDPISQREFYQLAAFFNNTTQRAMDGNIHDTPPIVPVVREQDRPRYDALQSELKEATASRDARKKAARADHEAWLANPQLVEAALSPPTEGLLAALPLDEIDSASVVAASRGTIRSQELTSAYVRIIDKDGRSGIQVKDGAPIEWEEIGDFERDQPWTVSLWIRGDRSGLNGAALARMDSPGGHRGWDVWLQGDRVGTHLIHRWPDEALKVVAKKGLPAKKWTHVAITYDGSSTVQGFRIYYNGQPQELSVEASRLTRTTRTAKPLAIGQRHPSDRALDVMLSDVRIFGRAIPAGEVDRLSAAGTVGRLLARKAADRTAGDREQLFNWWLTRHDPEYQQLDGRIAGLKAEESSLRSRGTVAHVMNESSKPAMAHVLNRGEYDQRRDQVAPGTPAVLPAFPAELPKNRLGLARWLLQPDHPLTARVTVNRFWQELFGQGLVRTSGDFGVAGELPSHPELLDWLAVEFRESGWDVKKFFRMLVCSETYKQSAVTTPEKRERDPHNRLLSRGPRFRMDAEMVRDAALTSSGLLVRKIGGPSVKPYQPEGVWEAVAMIGSNTRDYQRDSGEKLYRRSVYTFWKRAAPPASLDILNAPNRETCAVRRERTNTPLQALVTLNDPQFVEAARVLAEKCLVSVPDDPARLDWMTVRVLGRRLSPTERPIAERSLAQLLAHYREQAEEAGKLLAVGEWPRDKKLDAPTHAAWTMLANQLMNLDEALCK